MLTVYDFDNETEWQFTDDVNADTALLSVFCTEGTFQSVLSDLPYLGVVAFCNKYKIPLPKLSAKRQSLIMVNQYIVKIPPEQYPEIFAIERGENTLDFYI